MKIVHDEFRFVCKSLFIMYLISMTTTASTSRKPIKIWKGQVWIKKHSGYEAFFFNQPFEDKMFITDETCYGECDISTTQKDDKWMKGIEMIYYEVKFYKIRLDLAGTFVACTAPHDIKNRPPYYEIKGDNCDRDNRIELYPKPPEDGLDITITYIFMDKTSKKQLATSDKTVGYLPVYDNKNYETRIFGIVSYKETVKCTFSLNGNKLKTEKEKVKKFCRYAISVSPDTKYAGTYVFQCSAEYLPKKKKKRVKIKKKKTIELRICKDHSILMKSEFVVPVEQSKLVIKFKVFSSYKITKVTVEKVEGKRPQNIIVKHISHSTWISRYEVTFPQLSMEMDGEYAVVAEAKSGKKTPKKVFKLTISQALEVNVVPEKSVVDLGKDASFDCVATGNELKGIKWEMEGNEKLGPTAKTETLESKDNSLALHLSFSSLRYEDSGWYICTAWTRNKNLKSTKQVELLVLPPGSDLNDDDEDDDEISEDEIYTEFGEQENDNKHTNWKERLLKHKKKLVIVAGCCLVATIMIVLVIICVVVKCRKRNRSTVSKTDQHQLVDEEEYENEEDNKKETSTIKDEDETKQADEGRLLDDYSSPDGSEKEEITPRQEKKKKRPKKQKVKKAPPKRKTRSDNT